MDNNNSDLLDSLNKTYFSEHDIKTFNIVEGKKVEIYNGSSYPRNFFLYKNDVKRKYYMRVFIEEDSMVLQLNSQKYDTITSLIEKNSGSRRVTQIWYNGKLMWKMEDGSPMFTIQE